MPVLGRSWKTTMLGILVIAVTIAKVGSETRKGKQPDLLFGLAGATVGAGLILGKDHDV